MNQDKEPGPIPDHHRQWFNQLKKAGLRGDLALMSCLDVDTGEPRSVICLVGWHEGDQEYLFTPVGHLCTKDNPYEAYGPPSQEHEVT